MNSLPHPKYRPDIDGLRAIAVLSVIAFHASSRIISGGFAGVDIFFVISGFLISSIILKGLENNAFSFATFYSRRIRRIFPALITVLSASWLIGWFVLLPDEFQQLGKHIASSTVFISNFVLNSESGYFDATELKPLLHLWSLGIEEQFYLIYPLILYLAWRMRLNLIGIILGLALISFVLNIARITDYPSSTFYFPQTRFWELLAGGVLAYITLRRTTSGWSISALLRIRNQKQARNMASIAGGLLILGALFGLNQDMAFPGWWALLPVSGAFLLIGAGPGAWLNRTVMTRKSLVFIGVISYPLYLWHYPLLAFVRIIEYGNPSPWLIFAAMIAGFPLAWLTYRLIEHPLRFNLRKRVLWGLIVTMVLIGLVGQYTKNKHGFGDRFKDPGLAPLTETVSASSTPGGCPKGAPASMTACAVNDKNIPPTAVLIGDSHAGHFYFGLNEYLKKQGENSMVMWQGTCPPIYGIDVPGKCKGAQRDALDYAINTPSVHTVFLAFQGRQYTGSEDNVKLTSLLNPDETDRTKIFSMGLDLTIEKLLAAHKNVVFILDDPNLNFEPKTCYYKRPFTQQTAKTPCGIKRSVAEERNDTSRQLLKAAQVKYPSIHLFDTFNYLCDKEYCYAIIDNTRMYSDNNHLTKQGSFYLSEHYGSVFNPQPAVQH